jgi:MFS family permease
LAELVGDKQVMRMEMERFEGDVKAQLCHHVLSLSRWSLFVFPILVSTLYALSNSSARWESASWRWRLFYVGLFLVDCLITVILFWGMGRAAAEQKVWKEFLKTINDKQHGKGNHGDELPKKLGPLATAARRRRIARIARMRKLRSGMKARGPEPTVSEPE